MIQLGTVFRHREAHTTVHFSSNGHWPSSTWTGVARWLLLFYGWHTSANALRLTQAGSLSVPTIELRQRATNFFFCGRENLDQGPPRGDTQSYRGGGVCCEEKGKPGRERYSTIIKYIVVEGSDKSMVSRVMDGRRVRLEPLLHFDTSF